MEEVDLVVIGSGQGGRPLALAQAAAGRRVVLFERARLGGTCVNNGCTPSKAFLAAAHNAGRARSAESLGIHATVRVDQEAVMQRVRRIRDDWHGHAVRTFAESSVEVVHAEGRFTGDRIVSGGGRTFRGERVVIDTGSRPLVPKVAGLAQTPYLTNETFFDLERLPQRLAVLGAGYIGMELGQGAARLGSDVTIVGRGARVLAQEDADASDVVRRAFEAEGIAFRPNADTQSVSHNGRAFTLTFAEGAPLEADALLVATGRRSNADTLDAERSAIALDERGVIVVDERLQTTCPGVYAIGEAAGQAAFTHVSWEDYRRLESIFAGRPRTRHDRVLSYSTFTEPQLARTGINAAQARQLTRPTQSRTLPLTDVARGAEWNLDTGFYRMIVDEENGTILGATLVGYEAGEIVHSLAFAIERGATWRDVDAFVAIHPTFGEALPSLAREFAN